MRRRTSRPGSILAPLLLASVLPAQVELGLGKMWTFEAPPLDYLEREHGWRPDADWLRQVMLASLRFGRGCSASFVSPQGLILTNHHCARNAIAEAQGGHDWVRDGFVARFPKDEVRLPGLTVQQLVATRDVTAAVQEGVAEGDPPDVAEQKRQRNQEAILAAARQEAPDAQWQVVKLFHGVNFQLYRYRVFDDIRLVMAPHLQVAHFGGDPDNFTYPRFGIDFAFCRAYVDGRPADTSAHHFRWSSGAAPEELVILTGNPGGTQRLLTRAQLEYLRDARYPRVRQMIDNRLEILRHFAASGPDLEKRLRTMILGLENGQKLYRGEHAALQDPDFLRRKADADHAVHSRVAADPALHARFGDLWRRLEDVAGRKKALEGPVNFHTAGGSPHLLRALAVLAGDADGARAVRFDADPVQRSLFADHLARARHWLPPEDPFLVAILGRGAPADAVASLERNSRLHEPEFLAVLLADPARREADPDPALVIARVLAPLSASARAAWSAITAEEEALGARLAQAVFAIHGNTVSPDATFTLRFSDGRVRGYAYNGSVAPARTSFYGMFARHAEFDGLHPFDLPAVWLERQNRLDLAAPVNFVCTVDSTGGNSGSPVINTRRELVGLLFDGNFESLANEFLYGETAERSVCVHPRAIEEALSRIYDAERVVRELWGR